MDFNQGELNFDSPANDATGYQKWREEMDARKREIESRYGIILGKPVHLQLIGEDKPLQGILTIAPKTSRPWSVPISGSPMRSTTQKYSSIRALSLLLVTSIY